MSLSLSLPERESPSRLYATVVLQRAVCEGSRCHFHLAPHADTDATHFLWLQLFAYTLPLSSCLLAPTSCQTDRGFVPTRWQVSDGKALHLKKTLRPLSLAVSLTPPPPRLSVSRLFPFQASACFQRSNKRHQANSFFFFFFFFFYVTLKPLRMTQKLPPQPLGDPPGARLSSSPSSHPPDLQI